jgi:hypothetical protein
MFIEVKCPHEKEQSCSKEENHWDSVPIGLVSRINGFRGMFFGNFGFSICAHG